MLQNCKNLIVLVVAILLLTSPVMGKQEKGVMTGVVIGRSGEILHISVPAPVREGAVMEVRPITSEPPTAEVRILACTHERPYVAMAKVVRCDSDNIATGVRTYASAESVKETGSPQSMVGTNNGDPNRFSMVAGAFRPSSASLRDATADYWQEYRMNYDLFRMGGVDAQLSAGYAKGVGNITSGDSTINRTMEVLPVTMLGKIRPLRMGGTRLFLGAGAGWYTLRTTDTIGSSSVTDTWHKYGREYSAGLEHLRGWILELRYRDVPDTDIKGYSLSLGGKF